MPYKTGVSYENKFEYVVNSQPMERRSRMKKILVIDDEPEILKTIKRYLELEEYEVLTAENGQEGIEIFQQEKPTLVITDVKMPGMSGIDVLKKVKEIEGDTEVIVITGHGDLKISVHALRLDASDFISKPVDIEHLLLSVSRALDRHKMRAQIRVYTKNLEELLAEKTCEIKDAHALLLQSEKLASIGQLAAGVAHEINNPIGFISSNLNTLEKYIEDIKSLMEQYQDLHSRNNVERHLLLERIELLKEEMDFEFISDDLLKLVEETKDGADRIKKIVADLKDFSRVDHGERGFFDINQGMESTLNIVSNELKYKAEISKEYNEIPEIKCYSQELNQVFMNLLINAAQSIEKRGKIGIKTGLVHDNDHEFIEIRISDTGCGIAEDNLRKIFDPFFTTKDIGKGTGLGLNISYKVIEKHKGEIKVESEVGKGTTFIVRLPTEHN